MSNSEPCVAEFTLKALSSNQISELQLEEIEEHLTSCVACREKLDAIDEEPHPQWHSEICPAIRKTFVVSDTRTVVDEGPSHETLLQLLTPSDDPAMLGRIGVYEVAGIIGQGGMGVVFKAFEPALNRFVAIKMLLPHLTANGAARKRFLREAQAAAAVVDDHVLPIFGVDQWQGTPYLVMKYSSGQTLQQRIQHQGPLELKEVLRIGMQSAKGLAAAHAQGLVHRDVKPSNILLDGSVERAVIMDFGLARTVNDASVTRTGVVSGTPQYMSPEQVEARSVDPRSDLFSLGSVIYSMCAGYAPFRGESAYAVMHLIAKGVPAAIQEVNSDVPVWLKVIIERLMSKDPKDRFESAGEVAELLERCLAHVQDPTRTELPQTLVEASRDGGRTWRKWLAAACGGFLFLMLGVFVTLELNKGRLVIESEADGVPIRIMQGENEVEKLTVSKDGASVRIAAGNYRIEVDGDSDELVIDESSVLLMRGAVELVKVRVTSETFAGQRRTKRDDRAVLQIPDDAVLYFENGNLKESDAMAVVVEEMVKDGHPIVTINDGLHPELARKYKSLNAPSITVLRGGREVAHLRSGTPTMLRKAVKMGITLLETPQQHVTTYRLKHTKAEQGAETLKTLFKDTAVIAVGDNNSVVVLARLEIHEKVQSLLRKIDRPNDADGTDTLSAHEPKKTDAATKVLAEEAIKIVAKEVDINGADIQLRGNQVIIRRPAADAGTSSSEPLAEVTESEAFEPLLGTWVLKERRLNPHAKKDRQLHVGVRDYEMTFSKNKRNAGHSVRIVYSEPRKNDSTSRVTVNGNTTPRQINIFSDGVLMQGVYECEGDTLKIAFNGKPEITRPANVNATIESDPTHNQWILKRTAPSESTSEKQTDSGEDKLGATLARLPKNRSELHRCINGFIKEHEAIDNARVYLRVTINEHDPVNREMRKYAISLDGDKLHVVESSDRSESVKEWLFTPQYIESTENGQTVRYKRPDVESGDHAEMPDLAEIPDIRTLGLVSWFPGYPVGSLSKEFDFSALDRVTMERRSAGPRVFTYVECESKTEDNNVEKSYSFELSHGHRPAVIKETTLDWSTANSTRIVQTTGWREFDGTLFPNEITVKHEQDGVSKAYRVETISANFGNVKFKKGLFVSKPPTEDG